jgi:2-polyprenyl-3-methyl-5-hydroxy-6-metoxy-1,4-benzoquinol methylase
VTEAELRYEAERRQGVLIREGHEDAWGWTGAAGRQRAARRARFLIDAARLSPGVVCLEVGCGTGTFTELLAESGCEVVAVELSDATAEIARERVGDRATIVVGNVETGHGIPVREYDAIVGVSVLHHLDLELFLQNTFPLLRSGGRFAFSEPNMRNPQIWLERHVGLVKRMRHVTPHETAFTAPALRLLLESHGLNVEVAEPFEFLHPQTPAALVPLLLRTERVVERTPLRAIAGSVRVSGRRP